LIPVHQRNRYGAALAALLEEVKVDYQQNLRQGTVNMLIRNPELEQILEEQKKQKV
jgi:hypothetical protein